MYDGTMDDRHLRAVIRVALRAHGFAVREGDVRAAVEHQWRLGCWLRDHAWPADFPAFFAGADYRALATADPFLWDRLPLMAGLGYEHASAFRRLARVSPDADAAVAVLGATFNAAIALLDYLADEKGQGARLFEELNRDVVRAIFERDADDEGMLAWACRRAPDPAWRFLFALVAMCAAGGRRLLRRGDNRGAWAELGRTIGRVYEAQRVVSLTVAASVEARRALLPAAEAKSTLPSIAMLQIAHLVGAGTGRRATATVTATARRTATALGHVFRLADDVVDLLTDCRRGASSPLVIQLADLLEKEGRARAADADIYDVVDAAAGELVALLRLDDSGGADVRADPAEDAAAAGVAAGSVPPEWDSSPGDASGDAPDEGLAEVRSFACLTVAKWVGWVEDARAEPAPARPRGPMRRRHPTRSAIQMLLSQQGDGYREAIHHLYFPRAGWHYHTYPALLSHRAVVLDCLLDARAAGLPMPVDVLNAEAMAILRAKHRAVRGGWSYIPEVPELPPDTDDLGQVLQVLHRLGGPELASTCDEAVRLALDAAEPDGGINTWIIDPRGHAPGDAAVLAYLPVMGGWGVHPEVVANLLYGLILYDPARYDSPLRRAAAYLQGVQSAQGYWASKWYAGPYYGTYRATWALGHLAPDCSALDRARAFLLESQRPDGSWGEAGGEPLSAALALLGLAAPGMPGMDAAHARGAIARGVDYLERAQEADGGWPACPWITFPTSDGYAETYGSRTITTAFCLKALLAAAPEPGTPRR